MLSIKANSHHVYLRNWANGSVVTETQDNWWCQRGHLRGHGLPRSNPGTLDKMKAVVAKLQTPAGRFSLWEGRKEV